MLLSVHIAMHQNQVTMFLLNEIRNKTCYAVTGPVVCPRYSHLHRSNQIKSGQNIFMQFKYFTEHL